MSGPPDEIPAGGDILLLFNRAIQIRDLPEEMRPIPANPQVPSLPSDTASGASVTRTLSKFQPPKFPNLDLTKRFTAPAPGRSPPIHTHSQQ